MTLTLELVRQRTLVILVALAAVTIGCGQGSTLPSTTGPSSITSTLLTEDGAVMASVDGEFGTLAKSGNGKGKGNTGSDDGDTEQDDAEDNENEGPGNRGRGVLSGFVDDKGTDTLTVRGITVQISETTIIRHGHRILTFADIEIGDHVQARGEITGTTLAATEVKVEDTGNDNDDGDDDDAEIRGAVAGLGTQPNAGCTATPAGLTFTVGTSPATTVKTNASTVFDGVTCANLANGNIVEVEGTTQADGSILAKEVELEGGPNEVEGKITSVDATTSCPTRAFFIGTQKVTTTGSTTYSGSGAPACGDLAVNKKVEVEGTLQGDGSITAAVIEFK